MLFTSYADLVTSPVFSVCSKPQRSRAGLFLQHLSGMKLERVDSPMADGKQWTCGQGPDFWELPDAEFYGRFRSPRLFHGEIFKLGFPPNGDEIRVRYACWDTEEGFQHILQTGDYYPHRFPHFKAFGWETYGLWTWSTTPLCAVAADCGSGVFGRFDFAKLLWIAGFDRETLEKQLSLTISAHNLMDWELFKANFELVLDDGLMTVVF